VDLVPLTCGILQFSDRGAVIMRCTELYRGFVPQSEDFYISINS